MSKLNQDGVDGAVEMIAFCESCGCDRAVRVVPEVERVEIDGTGYTYPAHHGYCLVCGSPATPQDVLESNQLSFDAEVRRNHSIVSREVIRRVPTDYNIGVRPLSNLLGWGEHTYARYLEGDIPNKAYSDKISAIAASPLSYLLVALERGESIAPVALRKTIAAAKRALVERGTKLERAAAYLIGKTGSNSSLGLQKELYYAQGISLAFLGHPMFDEECEAWAHGPVFPSVWENVKVREVDEEVIACAGLDECVRGTFSLEELEVLDAVVSGIACYSPYTLRDVTHREMPWLSARGDTPKGEPSSAPISNDTIGEYFTRVRIDCGLQFPADMSLYMSRKVMSLQREKNIW